MSSAPLKMGHAVSILHGPKTGMDFAQPMRHGFRRLFRRVRG